MTKITSLKPCPFSPLCIASHLAVRKHMPTMPSFCQGCICIDIADFKKQAFFHFFLKFYRVCTDFQRMLHVFAVHPHARGCNHKCLRSLQCACMPLLRRQTCVEPRKKDAKTPKIMQPNFFVFWTNFQCFFFYDFCVSLETQRWCNMDVHIQGSHRRVVWCVWHV